MNRKEAAELLPIIQAFAKGKDIEYRTKGSNENWKKVTQIPELSFKSFEYRIKPEPKFRPFANAEECCQEMMKHQPFGWITSQGAFFYIIYIEDKLFGYGSACGTILHSEFNDVLKRFTFADGTPFGIKEE
mgnify:FL=1